MITTTPNLTSLWHDHYTVVILSIAFCVWISCSLILRMWLLHKRETVVRKVIWSMILLIPFFGWLAYGGGFTPLTTNSNQCPIEHSQGALGGGDSGGHGHF